MNTVAARGAAARAWVQSRVDREIERVNRRCLDHWGEEAQDVLVALERRQTAIYLSLEYRKQWGYTLYMVAIPGALWLAMVILYHCKALAQTIEAFTR